MSRLVPAERGLDPLSLHGALAAIVASLLASGCGGKFGVADGGPVQEESSAGAGQGESGAAAGGAGAQGGSSTTPVGGGSGGTSEPVDAEPKVPQDLVCNDAGYPSLVAGMNPTEPVDYLALREQILAGPTLPPPTLKQSSGTPCAAAEDPEACQSELSALAPTSGFVPGLGNQVPSVSYFVFTRGDAVGAITSSEALVDFLGAIDTANEAAAVLWANYRSAPCATLLEVPDGYAAEAEIMIADCPVIYQTMQLHVARDAVVSETQVGEPRETGVCVGRRPEGLELSGSTVASPGAYFAEVAHLELAAVAAFALLRRELLEHGAPGALLERLAEARDDEARHHQATAELAERYGYATGPVCVSSRGVRSLLEIALENAREGTVRELYGAAVAEWQARTARDPEVQRCFRTIAKEEARHAAVSLDVERFLWSRLTSEERSRVEGARAGAFRELRSELSAAIPEETRVVAGLPTARQAQCLLDTLGEALIAA